MALTAIVHIMNEDPIMCELEAVPDPEAQAVVLLNPRRRDGKDVHYLEDNVTTVIVPWHRINLIQVMPGAEAEEIIGFVRE
jgi:hypothetical protein